VAYAELLMLGNGVLDAELVYSPVVFAALVDATGRSWTLGAKRGT